MLLSLLLVYFSGEREWVFEMSNVRVESALVSDPSVPEQGYRSVLAAVVAASNRYNPDSIALNREHVGAILKCRNAGYFYTHGTGAAGQAPVEFAVAKPKRCQLAALWHTHGAEASDRNLFSPSDTTSANALGKPIYMTNHTGRLYVYKPGQRTAGNRKSGRNGMLPMPRGAAEGTMLRDRSGGLIEIRTELPTRPRSVQPLLAAARSSE